MPKRAVVAVLTQDARQDIREISRWSEVNFGKQAAIRYRKLLKQALRDLEADPYRPGSRSQPELLVPSVRTYHVSLSRGRVEPPGVKQPRHYILYRTIVPGVIEIARILHDRSDLSRHVPPTYRTGE